MKNCLFKSKNAAQSNSFQYTQNSLFEELKNISANYQKSLDLYIVGFLIEIYEILFFYNSILNKIKPINEN